MLSKECVVQWHVWWSRCYDWHDNYFCLPVDSFTGVFLILSFLCPSSPGGYTATHPVITIFWEVVESFTDEEKRKLLKFVTSCSRPPLLGFKVRVDQKFTMSVCSCARFIFYPPSGVVDCSRCYQGFNQTLLSPKWHPIPYLMHTLTKRSALFREPFGTQPQRKASTMECSLF